MKNMKKYIIKRSGWLLKTVLFTLSFSLLTSCNDWLDVEPTTEMDRNDLFSNEAGFADAMSGIYTILNSDALYGKNMTWYLLEMMGGGAYAGSGLNSYIMQYYFHPNTPYSYFKNYQNNYIDPIWKNAYNAIANINSILECIDEKKNVFVGDDYSIIKGEALGLRAFLHFDLMRLYTDAYSSDDYSSSKVYMPYVSNLTSDVYALAPAEFIAQSILKDLTDAKELLKKDPILTGATPSQYTCDEVSGLVTLRNQYGIKDWHNRRLHFNYYAAVATMARLYLWTGKKEQALACAKEIIDAPADKFPWVNTDLIANVTSTSNTVARDRTFCTEQIMALNVIDLDDRIDGILQEKQVAFRSTNQMLGMNTNYIFDAATRDADPRYAYLRFIYSDDMHISSKLYQDADQQNQYFPWAVKRIPLIKLAEMYYIAAECEPSLDKAVEYLETVRRHRGMAPYPLKVTNREELQQEIENEYRKEFISEGQLFYYHKRLNQSFTNTGFQGSYNITPEVFTMPRPDEEDTYGGRTN